MRPAQFDEGELGHALGRFGHETLAMELWIEPEAALVAARTVVGPEINAPDQVGRPAPRHDHPMALLAARHLAEAVLDMARRAVSRVGPGHAGIEPAHDLPFGEAA